MLYGAELSKLTLPDLIVHPDPVIRWLIKEMINRLDELEEKKHVVEKLPSKKIPCYS